jgi:hypothetical protein
MLILLLLLWRLHLRVYRLTVVVLRPLVRLHLLLVRLLRGLLLLLLVLLLLLLLLL